MSAKQDLFSYKGYFGSAEVSHEDKCLIGELLYVDDLVMYEAANYGELEGAFRRSVNDYLSFCKKVGKEPAKTYSGSFNVRIGPDLHSKVARAAQRAGSSLNDYVRQAIARATADAVLSDSASYILPSSWFAANAATTYIDKEATVPSTSVDNTVRALIAQNLSKYSTAPSQEMKLERAELLERKVT